MIGLEHKKLQSKRLAYRLLEEIDEEAPGQEMTCLSYIC